MWDPCDKDWPWRTEWSKDKIVAQAKSWVFFELLLSSQMVYQVYDTSPACLLLPSVSHLKFFSWANTRTSDPAISSNIFWQIQPGENMSSVKFKQPCPKECSMSSLHLYFLLSCLVAAKVSLPVFHGERGLPTLFQSSHFDLSLLFPSLMQVWIRQSNSINVLAARRFPW